MKDSTIIITILLICAFLLTVFIINKPCTPDFEGYKLTFENGNTDICERKSSNRGAVSFYYCRKTSSYVGVSNVAVESYFVDRCSEE